MKILQIGKYYALSGGIEKVVYNLQEGLSSATISCDILCIHNDLGKKEDVKTTHGYIYASKAFCKLASTSFSIDFILKLRKISKQYDIIQLHHPNPMGALALFLVGLDKKQKLIVHWHSDIIKQKALLRVFRPLQNWMLKRADVIVGTTTKYIEHSDDLRPYINKTISIPIGIDSFTGSVVPEKLSVKYSGKKIIFSLGRLCYYKGFDTLITAAKYLPQEYIVLIGGDGELRESLHQHIAKEGVADKVELLGRVPDNELAHYFSLCDVYCMSSVEKSEAFGVVLLEAFSLAKPVVATTIVGSGVSWVNKHDFSGINVEPYHPEALAKAIINILNDKVVYERFSKNALKRFNEVFRKQYMVDGFLNLYRKLGVK